MYLVTFHHWMLHNLSNSRIREKLFFIMKVYLQLKQGRYFAISWYNYLCEASLVLAHGEGELTWILERKKKVFRNVLQLCTMKWLKTFKVHTVFNSRTLYMEVEWWCERNIMCLRLHSDQQQHCSIKHRLTCSLQWHRCVCVVLLDQRKRKERWFSVKVDPGSASDSHNCL